MANFSERVIAWQSSHGRHGLPWQQNKNRYRVWVSEIMLQQTQVATVIPYFEQFMLSFPSVKALAEAAEDDVLAHWAGLGYYARARNLHKAAQQVVNEYGAEMPTTMAELEGLCGIGRSTAAAILSLTDDVAEPILDGNVKRVLARHALIAGWSGASSTQKVLWQRAEELMPNMDARTYNQGLMDLGNQVCKRSKPLCSTCPVNSDCMALSQDRVAEFPASKPRKALPQKTAAFLLLRNEAGDVWLEKRPPVGIWGGLWCLPQFDSAQSLQNTLGLSVLPMALNVVQHTFSHYHLSIEPYYLSLGTMQKTLTIAEESGQFVALKYLKQYGLPAPIEALLHREVAELNGTVS